jgi:cell division protein YceG involved in septum cleavage
MEEKTETKKSSIVPIVLVIVVIVVLAGVWYWARESIVRPVPTPPPTKPVEKITPKEDSVTAINQDLDKVEILNLDQEFQGIDQDLNSL